MLTTAITDLRALQDQPYRLLAILDQRLQASATEAGVADGTDAWTGLGFRIGDQWYVAPQREIREVITPPQFSRVPNARDWLQGVANVRGSLLPLIDTRLLLGESASTIGRDSRYLVMNSDDTPAGFLVDAVTGYRRFAVHEQRNDLTGKANAAWRDYLLGAFVRDEQSWMVFSFLKLIAAEAFQNASA